MAVAEKKGRCPRSGGKARYDVLEARYGEEAMAERRAGGGSYLPP